MELIAMYRKTLSDFVDRAERVDSAQLSAATPCPDWDVRALLNHVVNEDRWTVPLFAGQTIAEVGDLRVIELDQGEGGEGERQEAGTQAHGG